MTIDADAAPPPAADAVSEAMVEAAIAAYEDEERQTQVDAMRAAIAAALAARGKPTPRCTCLTGQLGPDYCEVHAA
jgi:hypothetical protein